jgi:hypothetical protein
MTRTYCTYFDSRYLTRGLALWESLSRHCAPFELHALCLDDAAYDALVALALPSLVPLRLAELEAADPELLRVKPSRSTIEYYFTLTPSLTLHILRGGRDVTYLDADLFFFDSIEPLFDEFGGASIGIIRHRFPPALAELEQWGVFNVGCVIFRNDANGRACLEWWRERCLEWCYDRIEGDRFADQKYLDRWPSLFEGVKVLEHRGANVAPWNAGGSDFRDGGGVLVDGAPLLFYHFHGLRSWSASLWQLGFARYRTSPPRLLVKRVYRPYIAALHDFARRTTAARGNEVRKTMRIRPADLVRAPLYLLRRELIVQSPRSAPPPTPS